MMLDSLKGNVKIPGMSINELFERNVNINKSQPMVIFNGKFITYYKFFNYVNSMASGLNERLKIKDSSTIGILLENGPEFIISVLSILRTGSSVLVLNEMDISNPNFYNILQKLNVKNIVISEKFYNLIKRNNGMKYIVADNTEFLTLWDAIKRSLKNRIKIKYTGNTMKFSDFIYDNKKFDEIKICEKPGVIFLNGDEIIGFTDKNLISSAILLNYWLPKFDRRPYIYSAIDMHNPLGLIYSFLLPISFSGTLVYGNMDILKKIDVDFLIGFPSFFDRTLGKRTGFNNVRYFISPNCTQKPTNSVFKATGKKIICGHSNERLLTTHLNPFEDIREGSIGVPLSNVQYKINEDGTMAIKSDQSASYIYDDNEFISSPEWVNTHIKVKIIDEYFYPAQQDISH